MYLYSESKQVPAAPELDFHTVTVWIPTSETNHSLWQERLWDSISTQRGREISLWPWWLQVNLPILTGCLVLFLRGVRQASPSNPRADQASPRTSTRWLSQETYCTARAFSKVSLPLLDLIYRLMIVSLLGPDVFLTSVIEWVGLRILLRVVEGIYYGARMTSDNANLPGQPKKPISSTRISFYN